MKKLEKRTIIVLTEGGREGLNWGFLPRNVSSLFLPFLPSFLPSSPLSLKGAMLLSVLTHPSSRRVVPSSLAHLDAVRRGGAETPRTTQLISD